MSQVSYNWDIFDCFSSGICLRLHVTETYRCLCLSLKSTKATSLLRVEKKLCHCSSSSREQQSFFSLPFSNASFVAERHYSFVGVLLQHREVPSLLHHRSVVPQASSIVAVIEIAESPLLLFNLASRYVFLLFLIMKPSCVSNVRLAHGGSVVGGFTFSILIWWWREVVLHSRQYEWRRREVVSAWCSGRKWWWQHTSNI